MPSIFGVSPSTVNGNGTFTVSLNTESANKVFKGPNSGGAAVPTFASLVLADLPAIYAGIGSPAQGSIGYINSSGALVCLAPGTSGYVLTTQGASANPQWTAAGSGGIGTVTSVALTAPAILSVSGSPVTTSGTLALSLANQNANLVWAGPSSGSPAAPTFRSLVATDIPALSYVTSVGLSLPGIITVSGSPVTSSGTLTGTLATQSANTLWAGPTSGGAATPTFRVINTADLGTGTANSTTFLRGDLTWQSVTAQDTGSQLLYANTSVPGGNTVSNTTSATAFTSSYTVPASSLVSGEVLRIKCAGVYGTAVAAPGTLTLTVKAGSTVLATVTSATVTGNLSNQGWWLEAAITVDTIGSSGTWMTQAIGELEGGVGLSMWNNGVNTSTATINTTVTQALTVVVTWSSAQAANTITLEQMYIEALQVAANGISFPTPTGSLQILYDQTAGAYGLSSGITVTGVGALALAPTSTSITPLAITLPSSEANATITTTDTSGNLVYEVNHPSGGQGSIVILSTGAATGVNNKSIVRVGSLNFPQATANPIGNFNAVTYGNSAFQNCGTLQFQSAESSAMTSTTLGTDFVLALCAIGSATITNRVIVRNNGDIQFNGTQSALATNATGGFPYVPYSAGQPTGTPTARTGGTALCDDTTNNLTWRYNTSSSVWAPIQAWQCLVKNSGSPVTIVPFTLLVWTSASGGATVNIPSAAAAGAGTMIGVKWGTAATSKSLIVTPASGNIESLGSPGTLQTTSSLLSPASSTVWPIAIWISDGTEWLLFSHTTA